MVRRATGEGLTSVLLARMVPEGEAKAVPIFAVFFNLRKSGRPLPDQAWLEPLSSQRQTHTSRENNIVDVPDSDTSRDNIVARAGMRTTSLPHQARVHTGLITFQVRPWKGG